MAYILYDIIMRSVLLKYYAGFPIIGVIDGFIRGKLSVGPTPWVHLKMALKRVAKILSFFFVKKLNESFL